jgi:signal transduction histidine kinase
MLVRDPSERQTVAEVAADPHRSAATSERTVALVHALRNQLCVVMMGVETLELCLAPGDAEIRAVLADMRSAASSGTEVVRRLLDLSRAGRAADETPDPAVAAPPPAER